MYRSYFLCVLLSLLPLFPSQTAVAGGTQCLSAFASTHTHSPAVDALFFPTKLIQRLNSMGQEIKIQSYSSLDTKVKLKFYTDFLKQALFRIEQKKEILKKEKKMAFSLYIKEEIDTYFLPKIQQTKQLVQSALNKLKNNPETSISLNKLLVIGFSIAMTQDFMSTEQTKNLMVRQFKEDHSTINFDSMSDQEFYHFYNTIDFNQLENTHFTSKLAVQSDLDLEREFDRWVGKFKRGHAFPLFTWHIPNQYVQLVAAKNFIHLVSFISEVMDYDFSQYEAPSEYTLHDLDHRTIKVSTVNERARSVADATFSQYDRFHRKLKIAIQQAESWLFKNKSKLTDFDIYSVIHLLSVQSHEMNISAYSIPPSPVQQMRTLSVFASSAMFATGYYGERLYTKNDKLLIDNAFSLLMHIYDDYNHENSNLPSSPSLDLVLAIDF